MKAEIIHEKLTYTTFHHEVQVEINGKTLTLNVTVEDGHIESMPFSEDCDLWNKLDLEEKYAIEEAIHQNF